MSRNQQDQPPVRYCPEKGCGKKMAAFKRGKDWTYLCPDAAKHVQDKLKASQAGGPSGRGGVRKGTPSPLRGKKRPKKNEGKKEEGQ